MNYETKILPSGIIIENKIKLDYKYWWRIKGTNLLHNEGEAAAEYINGDKYWYQHDKYHRLDGPAIEFANKTKRYYIDDFEYEEEDYWKHPKVKEYLYLKEHPELEGFT